MQPASVKRRTAASQIARVSRSTGRAPLKSAVKATRSGRGAREAAIGDRRRVVGQRVAESQPAMVSRNSARSGTLRAIGPCTDSGEKRLFDVPRVTRPGEGRRPTTPQ